MTTGLDGKAHRLVELARGGAEPSAAQLLSLHGAVSARIAAEGAIVASAAMGSGKAASAGALVKGLVAAGAIATGAASFFALQGAPEPAPVPAHTARSLAAKAAPSVHVEPAPPRPAALPPAPAPARTSRTNSSSSLRLQEEAALLAEVQGALRGGRPDAALGKLASYDRRFPQGMMRSEADAARVFALCAAGRGDKARAAAERFVQRYPSSPVTARVQSACK